MADNQYHQAYDIFSQIIQKSQISLGNTRFGGCMSVHVVMKKHFNLIKRPMNCPLFYQIQKRTKKKKGCTWQELMH